MKILFRGRFGLFSDPGGDTVQMKRLRHHLIERGVEVDLATAGKVNPADYDLVHLFNITQIHETAQFAREAMEAGVPCVLTPNYWSKEEFTRHSQEGLRPRLFTLMIGSEEAVEQTLAAGKLAASLFGSDPSRKTLFQQLLRGYRAQQIFAIENSVLIIPNAESEIRRIEDDLGLEKLPFKVVPNGVDEMFFHGDPDRFRKAYGIQGDFALCVGRIEERKNQLELIRALKGTDLKLVLVGDASIGHQGYMAKCRKASRGADVVFVNALKHEEMPSVFAACRVHALPSWYETPGLASLEAAASGARIATTDRGTVKEYFGDYAFYLDPLNPASIKKAVLDAFNSEPYPDLRRLIAEKYTWAQAARVLADVYGELLETK